MRLQRGKLAIAALPSGQLALILILGVLLSAYLFTLIINYNESREELKNAEVEQLRLETENRAAELAYFLSDAVSSITALGEMRELEVYFSNKALKMSSKYGLGASLLHVRQKFNDAVGRYSSNNKSIFSRIVFINREGKLLVDTAPASAQHDWHPDLTPLQRDAQLLYKTDKQLFAVSRPYFFKGQYRGQLLAWIADTVVSDELSASGHGHLQPDAIYSWDGKLLAAGDGWDEIVTDGSRAARVVPTLTHGSRLLFDLNRPDGVTAMIATKVLLPGIDYYLVSLNEQSPVFSVGRSQGLLYAGGVLPLLATIVLLVFLHLRRINGMLRSRYIESLEQRQKLRDEVTSRRQAEKELRAKQRQLLQRSKELGSTMEALQENRQMLNEAQRIAHVGSWRLDHSSGKLDWSDELFSILGLEPASKEADLERFLQSIHSEDRERMVHEFASLAGNRTSRDIVYRVSQPDGSVRVVMQQSRYMNRSHGNGVTFGIAYDITDRTKAENEQARLQRELEQAQKMEALGQLTGGIAHDFNNSLGIILGYTALARDMDPQSGQEKLERYLAKVEFAGERARKLIAQMLAFSRTSAISAKPMFLQQLVKEDIKLLRPTLPSSIDIHVRVADDLPAVLIDPVQVNQLLMNLSINARDAMNGTGTIDYRLSMTGALDTECACCHRRVQGKWIELSVSDTGPGIDRQIINKLFEPFFTTKEVGKGTGMGLAVVHGIVSGCGGRILVESKQGAGARFRLLFPPAEKVEPAVVGAEMETRKRPMGEGERVLVVDDEPELCNYIAELIELQGYSATTEFSSARALVLLQEHPDDYAVLITDQTMPALSGMELVARARSVNPDLPVILCTGYSEAVSRESAADLNIHYMEKPIKSDLLLQTIAEALAENHSKGELPRTAAMT